MALAHQPGLQRGHIGIGGHTAARCRPPGLRHHHARRRRRGQLLHQRLQQPPHGGRHALRRPCSALHRFSAARSCGRQRGSSRRGQARGPGRGRCRIALRDPTLSLRLQRLAGAGRQTHPVGLHRVAHPLGQRRWGQRGIGRGGAGRRCTGDGPCSRRAPFVCAQQHVLPLQSSFGQHLGCGGQRAARGIHLDGHSGKAVWLNGGAQGQAWPSAAEMPDSVPIQPA